MLASLIVILSACCATSLRLGQMKNPELELENWKAKGKAFDRAVCLKQKDECLPIEPIRIDEWRQGHNNEYGYPAENWVIYKADLIDITPHARKFYIDLGANSYTSSIDNWFLKRYPHSKDFKIIAFEAEHIYDESYAEHKEVELLHYAVWVENTTLPWGATYVNEDGPSSQDTRPSIDIADFLKRRVKEEDYVVVKTDIEGAEYKVVPHLIASGVTHLIDDCFVEVHTDINSMFQGEKAEGHHRPDALKLITDLRDAGVYAHEWA